MEKQHGLIEKPFKGFGPFGNDLFRMPVDKDLFFFCKLPCSVDNNRYMNNLFIISYLQKQIKTGHIRKTEVENHTVKISGFKMLIGIFACGYLGDVKVFIIDEFNNCLSLNIVIFDNQHVFDLFRNNTLNLSVHLFNLFHANGFCNETYCTHLHCIEFLIR